MTSTQSDLVKGISSIFATTLLIVRRTIIISKRHDIFVDSNGIFPLLPQIQTYLKIPVIITFNILNNVLFRLTKVITFGMIYVNYVW